MTNGESIREDLRPSGRPELVMPDIYLSLSVADEADISAQESLDAICLLVCGTRGHDSSVTHSLTHPLLLLPSFQYGDTPLATAARYGHAGVARILISAGCNPDLQNKASTMWQPFLVPEKSEKAIRSGII